MLAAARTTAALALEAGRVKEALSVLYHINFGMIRTDGGFKGIKA